MRDLVTTNDSKAFPVKEELENNELSQKMVLPKCGDVHFAGATDDVSVGCPSNCPMYAEERDVGFCHFKCVPAVDCYEHDELRPVPSWQHGHCRTCQVPGCLKCGTHGLDQCHLCKPDYLLQPDGLCYWKKMFYLKCLGVFLAILVLLIVIWIVDLACFREVTNTDGLNTGLSYRSRSKLKRDPQDMTEEARSSQEPRRSPLFPITTNLCTQDVGGCGIVLHFNFQVMVIIWAFSIAIAFAILSSYHPELAEIGVREVNTARDYCIVTQWGAAVQMKLMFVKVHFVECVYGFSFIGAIIHSIRQLRIYQNMDSKEATMVDYAVRFSNLPDAVGADKIEEQWQEALHRALGKKPVGLSVCWDYRAHEDTVLRTVEEDLHFADVAEKAADRTRPITPREDSTRVKELPWHSKHWFKLEKALFEPAQDASEVEVKKENRDRDVRIMCQSLTTCGEAIGVFASEQDAEAVINKCDNEEILVEGNRVGACRMKAEPDTVNWVNFPLFGWQNKVGKLIWGALTILFALLCWSVFIYLPYTLYIIYFFDYDHGQPPSFIDGLTFTLVIAIGNQIMYAASDSVASYMAFVYKDDQQACYVILYSVACLFNVLLDLVTTYYMAMYMMVSSESTYETEELLTLPFSEVFEKYTMQKSLGEQLMAYAYPATFLIPFVIEPLPTLILPYLIGMMVVRTHRRIKDIDAEAMMACMPYDLSRYGDLMLDVILAVLSFFFPPGYTMMMFLSLGFCHLGVYVYDHLRVLRSVQKCAFANNKVDWWVNAMMAFPCGILAAVIIFKANCASYAVFNLDAHGEVPHNQITQQIAHHTCDADGALLYKRCLYAFLLHIVIHLLLLQYFVPLFGADHRNVALEYSRCAATKAASWFSTNPVHCLRSKYIYGHTNPVMFYKLGKENLIKPNPGQGIYYKYVRDADWKEEYDLVKFMGEEIREGYEDLKGRTSSKKTGRT